MATDIPNCEFCEANDFEYHEEQCTYTCRRCFTQSRYTTQISHEFDAAFNLALLDKVNIKSLRKAREAEDAALAYSPWRFSQLMTHVLIKQVEALLSHPDNLILDPDHFRRTVRILWKWHLEGTGEAAFCHEAPLKGDKTPRQRRGQDNFPLGWGMLYEPKEGRQKFPVQVRKRKKRYVRPFKPMNFTAPCSVQTKKMTSHVSMSTTKLEKTEEWTMPSTSDHVMKTEDTSNDLLNLDALKQELKNRDHLREIDEFHPRGKEAIGQDVESEPDLSWLGIQDDESDEFAPRLSDEDFDSSSSTSFDEPSDIEEEKEKDKVKEAPADSPDMNEDLEEDFEASLEEEKEFSSPSEEESVSAKNLCTEERQIARQLKKLRSSYFTSIFWEARLVGTNGHNSCFLEINLCILYLALLLQPRRRWKLFTFGHLLHLVDTGKLPYYNVVGLVHRSRQFAIKDPRFQRMLIRQSMPKHERLFYALQATMDSFLPDVLPLPRFPLLTMIHIMVKEFRLPHDFHWLISRFVVDWWENYVLAEETLSNQPDDGVSLDGTKCSKKDENEGHACSYVRFIYPDAFVLANVLMMIFILYHLDQEYEREIDSICRQLNDRFGANLFIFEDWLEFWIQEDTPWKIRHRYTNAIDEVTAVDAVRRFMKVSAAETHMRTSSKYHNPSEFSALTLHPRDESDKSSQMTDKLQRSTKAQRSASAKIQFVDSYLPFCKSWIPTVRETIPSQEILVIEEYCSQPDFFLDGGSSAHLIEYDELVNQLQNYLRLDDIHLIPHSKMPRVKKHKLSPVFYSLLKVASERFYVDIDVLFSAFTLVEAVCLHQQISPRRTSLIGRVSPALFKKWFSLT